jgi:hypothetical protein
LVYESLIIREEITNYSSPSTRYTSPQQIFDLSRPYHYWRDISFLRVSRANVMRCEYCKRPIKHFETAPGFKHGVIRSYPEEFTASRDSAWTVICDSCSQKIYRLSYCSLKSSITPSIHKTFTQTR